MADKKTRQRVSLTNTKQEMLDAYNELVKQLEEKREIELKPEEKIEEKAVKKIVEVADLLSIDGIVAGIGNLKAEVGKVLNQLTERLDREVGKYETVKQAVEVKEKELQEIYEIQKSASGLAALLEAQNIKREEFEIEMGEKKEALTEEIQSRRAEWEKEKKLHETDIKEREASESKKRERENEEYSYALAREQQLARDQFEADKKKYADEKAELEKEIQLRKEQTDKEFAEREQVIRQSEEELDELRNKVAAFPKELETTLNKEVKAAVEKVQLEAANRDELLRKEFEGERNVLSTRVAALERTLQEQTAQIAKLNQQLEKAYSQVQDIAVKAVEGSSGAKTLSGLQQMMVEQGRGQVQEK
jgi:hypothetical protein